MGKGNVSDKPIPFPWRSPSLSHPFRKGNGPVRPQKERRQWVPSQMEKKKPTRGCTPPQNEPTNKQAKSGTREIQDEETGRNGRKERGSESKVDLRCQRLRSEPPSSNGKVAPPRFRLCFLAGARSRADGNPVLLQQATQSMQSKSSKKVNGNFHFASCTTNKSNIKVQDLKRLAKFRCSFKRSTAPCDRS